MVTAPSFPTGTVTFLFTDVEGSTRLWAADETAMAASLRVHDDILRTAIEGSGGYVFTTAGDSFAAAFSRASDGAEAAITAQTGLAAADWPGPELKVRMGLHVGEADERNGDYFGSTVSTAARVEAAGHGGQILMTEPVRAMAGVDTVDLGLHRLRDVEVPLELFQLGAGSFPPLRVVDPWLHNLPPSRTRLIGRDDDVAEVRRLLAADRLVTLLAVGGSGKTRLALSVGESELAHRSGGVWFVDLTAVVSGAEVPEAIAHALGLTLRAGDHVDQIIEYLSAQAALVVIDNCEHLTADVADFADRFLSVAGASTLLATSREMLDVEGERVYRVAPLGSDGAHSPGVALFADRAAAVDADFEIGAHNEAAVSALCARLDGIPLAIELAATRISVMTPAELLAGLDDRFQLLSGGRRRGRQRTLETTLDWSFDLLDAATQRVFRSLGVFVDGFDLDAAAAVADSSRGKATAAVQSLVSKSLLVRIERGETSRFGMLESVKAYAENRLDDEDEATDARRRHLDHFHSLGTAYGLAPLGELRLAFALRHDLSNITAAFETAAAGDEWVRAAELLNGTFTAYENFGRVIEGFALVDRVVENCDADAPETVDHLLAASLQSYVTVDDFAEGQRVAIRLSNSTVPGLRVIGLAFHGWAVSYSQPERSAELLVKAQEELDVARAEAPGRNTELAASFLCVLRAGHLCVDFEYEAALRDGQESSAIEQRLDYHTGAGSTPGGMVSMCLLLLGRPDESLEIFAGQDTRITEALQVASGELNIAFAHLERGDLEEGRQRVRRLAVRGIARRYAYEANDCLVLLARLAMAEGESEIATDLVLRAGTGTGWAVILADNLAMRLEVVDERHRRILESIRSRDTAHNTTQAAVALRGELERRGWLPA